MGITYKVFQSLSYFGLECAREKGIKVDKAMQRERRKKLDKEIDEIICYDEADRHWDNLLQGCWDNAPPAFGKKCPTRFDKSADAPLSSL